jgi:hypothetical protein
LSPSFLRMTPARKPRTECCCHSVAAIIAAIVAPAGARSMATIWACLVSGRVADLGDAGADRLRDVGLAVFRAVERVAAFGLDLDLVMESSEVHATPSAAPPQPRPGKFSRFHTGMWAGEFLVTTRYSSWEVYGKVQEAVAKDEAFAKLWAHTSTFAELTGRNVAVGIDL